MKTFIIKDWTGKVCFNGKEFTCFHEAWGFIYQEDPNTNEDDHFYDDYFVEEKIQ